VCVAPGSIEPMGPLGRDREIALSRIQQAFVEGHLSSEDLDDRLHRVLTARTRDEVSAALDSLPEPDEGRVVSIAAMRGRIRRDGPWSVPRVLRIESEYGSVDLDFSRATFETPVVDVELQLTYGRARIVVPADTVVDLDGLLTVWKQPRYRRPLPVPAGAPLIRISGSMEYGRLKVRHRRA
jgi:hypothetical protein